MMTAPFLVQIHLSAHLVLAQMVGFVQKLQMDTRVTAKLITLERNVMVSKNT